MREQAVSTEDVARGAAATAVRHAARDVLALCTGATSAAGARESGGADGDGRGEDDVEDGLHFGKKRVT